MKLAVLSQGNKKKVSIDHLQSLTFVETVRICCSAATYSTIQAIFVFTWVQIANSLLWDKDGGKF